MVIIRPISTKKELKAFVKFKIDLYKGEPNAVPPLYSDEIGTLLKGKNPALDLYDHQPFVAERDGRIVGRIVAVLNHVDNHNTGKKEVRFGWVDFIDDPEVADALFEAVAQWGRQRGMDTMHGPLGFTDFDPEGMLIDGFDQLATLITIYNYPYYPLHMERMGFHKAVDWIEFKIYVPEDIPEKHLRIARLAQEKYGLRVVRLRSVREIIDKGYGKKLFDLLNITYSNLYGYTRLSDQMIEHYINMYVSMLRLDMITLIADRNDNLVCIGVALPSLSRAMQKAGGKLFPFGFIPLLKALKGRPKVCDLMLIAVHPDYQSTGVPAMLFRELIPKFRHLGTEYVESNPELEENHRVQTLWGDFHTEQHKRRRIFEKKI